MQDYITMLDQGEALPPVAVAGKNCWRIAKSGRVGFCIDADAYFENLSRAMSQARRSIYIVGWDLNTRTRINRGAVPDLPERLGDFITALVKRRRGLHVYILLWDFAMIYAAERELFPIFRLEWRRPRRVHFRYDNRHPIGGSHHQKIVAIDDKVAFCGGIDLTSRRWDTSSHLAGDPRRLDVDNNPYPPFHDVQMAVDGECARALGQLCRSRWRRTSGIQILPPADPLRGRRLSFGRGYSADSDPWPASLPAWLENVDVAIARTYWGRGKDIREVERLYLDSIAAARKYIYLENQYFSSHSVAEALARRLAEPEGPEVVLVGTGKFQSWLEEETLGAARALFMDRLRKADRHGRLSAYYPRIPGALEPGLLVHSKVMIVDGQLARVGSANLANRSMGLDSECDLSAEAGGDLCAAAGIENLRDRLLAEHLNVEQVEVSEAIRRHGGIKAAIEQLRHDGISLAPLATPEPDTSASNLLEISLYDPERSIELESFMDELVPERKVKIETPWLLQAAFFLAALSLTAALWRWIPLEEMLDAPRFWERVSAMGHGPTMLLKTLLFYVVAGLFMAPVSLLVVITATLLGGFWGFVYGFLGGMAAAGVCYVEGMVLGRGMVRRLAGKRLNHLSHRIAGNTVVAIAGARLMGLAPFSVVNLVAGATRLRFRSYMVGSAIGMFPGVASYAIFGGMAAYFVRHPAPLNLILLAATGVALVLFYLWIRKRLSGGYNL